jgi:hypothetical protein
MTDVPEISIPQERVEVRPTVLGDLVPRDESKPRPSARILRK